MKRVEETGVTRFIATTPGLSSTRWLAFVLGSHPDVFVAHGQFPLDSVLHNNFQEEKKKGDVESLTIGNEMAKFYQTHSLTDVFGTYRSLKPDARAYGNIHSYTLEVLMRRVRDVSELDGIRVVNILRHPVSYIDSHFSLVRSAERHPALYRHYVENVFTDALRKFPELFLMDCRQYREFLAFAVSCLSVCNMGQDFVHSQFRHLKMEALTADSEALKEFCEGLTGLVYPQDRLQTFIHEGPINRHRHSRASTDPWEIYSGWPLWKQDMAFMMIPDDVLDRFAAEGYDIGMLRARKLPDGGAPDAEAPIACLADHLRMMDLHHPLLALLTQERPAETGLIEDNTHDDNLAQFADRPDLIATDYCGFNLVAFRGQIYGLACSLGPLDLPRVPPEKIAEYVQRGDWFVATSIEEVKRLILGDSRRAPVLIEQDFHGFNLVAFNGRIYGLACSLGPIYLDEVSDRALERYMRKGTCFVGLTVDEVKAGIRTALKK